MSPTTILFRTILIWTITVYYTTPQHNTTHALHRAVPYLTTLHYIAPHRAVLRCTAPYLTVPHRTALYRIAMHRTIPYYTAPHCDAPHHAALHHAHCSAPYRTALHRTAPRCTALHRAALHRTVPYYNVDWRCWCYCCLSSWLPIAKIKTTVAQVTNTRIH